MDPAIQELSDTRGADIRNLVQSVHPMYYECLVAPKLAQRFSDYRAKVRVKHAHKLPCRACRVYQRPQDIEYGSNSHFGTRPGCIFRGWVVAWRIHKSHSNRVDAIADLFRRQIQVYTQCRQNVCSSTFAGNRAIAML